MQQQTGEWTTEAITRMDKFIRYVHGAGKNKREGKEREKDKDRAERDVFPEVTTELRRRG